VRQFHVEKKLSEKIEKLAARDKAAYEALAAKMDEIINSPDIEHYKNLRKPLHAYKRVHFMKSFVLIFRHDPSTDTIYFRDFDHHDDVYRA